MCLTWPSPSSQPGQQSTPIDTMLSDGPEAEGTEDGKAGVGSTLLHQICFWVTHSHINAELTMSERKKDAMIGYVEHAVRQSKEVRLLCC